MRKSALLLFLAFAVLSSFCVNCGGSESKQAIQATWSSGDLSTIILSLKSLTGVTFVTTNTEHFAILHEVGADVVDTGKALEAAYLRFYEVFLKSRFMLSQSEDRLVWICFPQQSGFNRYALQAEGIDLSWLDGYYSTLTNRVAVVQTEPVRPPQVSGFRIALASGTQSEKILPILPPEPRLDLTRLTHELAHQLAFNSGIQKRGVMYPVWVSEGLSTNFECGSLENAGVLPDNEARCDCLRTGCADEELIPLRQLIVQTRVPPGPHAGRQFYGQAWAFFRFLLTERPEGLRLYLHRLSTLPAGRRSEDVLLNEFCEVFGVPEAIEGDWSAFIGRQIQPSATDGSAASLSDDMHTPKLP